MDDGEELAMRELLLDLETAVRRTNMLLTAILFFIVAALTAVSLVYVQLDAWQFATKVMAG